MTTKTTTMKLGPMSPETRAMLEENVRIGRAAEKALEAEKARELAEDPRVGQEFYIKFICREICPGGWARIEGPDGDIYELQVGHLLAVPAGPIGYVAAGTESAEFCRAHLYKSRKEFKRDFPENDPMAVFCHPAPANSPEKPEGSTGKETLQVARRFNAHDAIMYLIKEADLDGDTLRQYKRDFNGRRYEVTIQREDKA